MFALFFHYLSTVWAKKKIYKFFPQKNKLLYVFPLHNFRFTIEESHWLSRRVSKLEETWGSVSLGEDHLREFVMWSFDVPVGKNFFRNAIGKKNVLKNYD